MSKDQILSGPDEKGEHPLSKTSTFLGMCWQSIAQQLRGLYESALRYRGSEGSAVSLNQGDPGDAILQCDAEAPLTSPEQKLAGTEGLTPEAGTQPGNHVQARPIPLALVPGATVDGRYLIEKELGRGGFCVVFLARDQKLQDTPVVIKVLQEQAIEGAEGDNKEWLLQRFKREVQALARIDHPGVVRALDAGRLPDGRTFLVMQHVAGTNLRSALPARGMDLERVARLIQQIGQALDAAHKQGVIHRDLKPENIMLQRAGDQEFAKLIDFGIATVLDPQMRSNLKSTVVAGTIDYMAPEQLEGKPTVASDIYALGVISYEMVTGRRPFSPDSPYQLRDLQRAGIRIKPCDLRPSLPEAAQAVILKALSFAPQDRHASAQDFCQALNLALAVGPSRDSELRSTPIPLGLPLSALFFIVSACLALVISRRFLAHTPDIFGLSVSFLLCLFCLSVGSTFTRGGQHWVERGFARFSAGPKSFSRWRVRFTLIGLLVIGSFYLTLPAIAHNYYNRRAVQLHQAGDLHAAIRSYERAISLDPGYAAAHYNLASAYKDVLDFDRSVGEYQAALRLDPKSYFAYNHLAHPYPAHQKEYPGTDGGINLTSVNTGSASTRIKALMIDSRPPQSLKAGTQGGALCCSMPPMSSTAIDLRTGGAAEARSAGSNEVAKAGYAKVAIESGETPYGTAVLSSKQNGITVSEAGIPASPPTTRARLLIDYRSGVSGHGDAGTVDIDTGIAIVNYGSAAANISYALHNLKGTRIASGRGIVAAGAQLASGFNLPPEFPTSTGFGSLEISSDQPVSIVALRETTNQRKEGLFTTTPVADLTQPLAADPIYFPQFADGGGYATALVLLNTSGGVETGTLQLFDDNGVPLAVNQVGGTTDSSFKYSSPEGGVFRFQTDGFQESVKAGWVLLTPDAGTSTPVGAGIFSYSSEGILVSESGIPAAVSTTHARVYVDLSRGHDTGLAIANPANTSANITIRAYEADGVTPIGTSQGLLQLPGNGHSARFATELIPGLPAGFTGMLDITSATPFAALTLRSLNNERKDFLMTTFPVADANRTAPSPVVFPQIADGGGFVTEVILLNAGGASKATVSFFDNEGRPLDVGKYSAEDHRESAGFDHFLHHNRTSIWELRRWRRRRTEGRRPPLAFGILDPVTTDRFSLRLEVMMRSRSNQPG